MRAMRSKGQPRANPTRRPSLRSRVRTAASPRRRVAAIPAVGCTPRWVTRYRSSSGVQCAQCSSSSWRCRLPTRRHGSWESGGAPRTPMDRAAVVCVVVHPGFGQGRPGSGWWSAPARLQRGRQPGPRGHVRASTRRGVRPIVRQTLVDVGSRAVQPAYTSPCRDQQPRSVVLGVQAPGDRGARRPCGDSGATPVDRQVLGRRAAPRRPVPLSFAERDPGPARAVCRLRWGC